VGNRIHRDLAVHRPQAVTLLLLPDRHMAQQRRGLEGFGRIVSTCLSGHVNTIEEQEPASLDLGEF
jgi:hypothetical protein